MKNTNTLMKVGSMILLAITVSIVMLALVYALQHPQSLVVLGTIGWNR